MNVYFCIVMCDDDTTTLSNYTYLKLSTLLSCITISHWSLTRKLFQCAIFAIVQQQTRFRHYCFILQCVKCQLLYEKKIGTQEINLLSDQRSSLYRFIVNHYLRKYQVQDIITQHYRVLIVNYYISLLLNVKNIKSS